MLIVPAIILAPASLAAVPVISSTPGALVVAVGGHSSAHVRAISGCPVREHPWLRTPSEGMVRCCRLLKNGQHVHASVILAWHAQGGEGQLVVVVRLEYQSRNFVLKLAIRACFGGHTTEVRHVWAACDDSKAVAPGDGVRTHIEGCPTVAMSPGTSLVMPLALLLLVCSHRSLPPARLLLVKRRNPPSTRK